MKTTFGTHDQTSYNLNRQRNKTGQMVQAECVHPKSCCCLHQGFITCLFGRRAAIHSIQFRSIKFFQQLCHLYYVLMKIKTIVHVLDTKYLMYYVRRLRYSFKKSEAKFGVKPPALTGLIKTLISLVNCGNIEKEKILLARM